MGADPHNFVGDYYFQVSLKSPWDSNLKYILRQEAYRDGLNYDQLTAKFSWVLQMLNGFRPGARPKYIFVIRNGLSEGQFAEVVFLSFFTNQQNSLVCETRNGGAAQRMQCVRPGIPAEIR